MNFLGHLYFSNNDVRLMLANMYGDFIKGNDLSHLSTIQEKGVRLHREIDSYMDNQKDVRECMQQLYSHLPKVTGVAMDLYFDHLLAKNWANHHEKELSSFLQEFYDAIDKYAANYDASFEKFMHRLKDRNWISYYVSEYGLDKACHGVSSRISFENALVKGLKVFQSNDELIINAFEKYMAAAKLHFNQWHLDHI